MAPSWDSVTPASRYARQVTVDHRPVHKCIASHAPAESAPNEQPHWTSPNSLLSHQGRLVPDSARYSARLPTDGVHPEGRNSTGPAKDAPSSGGVRSSRKQTGRLSPRVFDVHRDADLPNSRLVRQQLSLVKLHGSAYGLRFGERLQYSLEDDARRKICGYVPDEALLVVMGFSGQERRMMQVIREFTRRPEARNGMIQVLWLHTTPGPDRSPFVGDLIKELKSQGLERAFVPKLIGDANSFLPGLVYRIASSFPATRQRYEALVSRPSIPAAPLAAGDEDALRNISSPAVVILSDESPRDLLSNRGDLRAPSSWPSLAAAELASQHPGRHTIWIDLENHHTVEAVVRDILGQIRRVDPGSPQLVLQPEPQPQSVGGELVKPIARIREALHRGRYLIVFDSLESFCRPHTAHHGLPRWEPDCKTYLEIVLPSVRRLCDFLCMLIGVDALDLKRMRPPLYDTIVVLSVTVPTAQHANLPHESNLLVENIRLELRKLLVERLKKTALTKVELGHDRSFDFVWLSRDRLKLAYSTQRSHAHDKRAAKHHPLLAQYRDPAAIKDRIALLVEAVLQRNRLRGSQHSAEPDKASKQALLAILSFFRRPRPLPVVRSVIARWLFDPGDLTAPRLLTAAFKSIDRTLDALAASNAIELFEGANIWIPRQVYEPLYEAMTAILSVRRLPQSLNNDRESVTLLLAALMASTWHLQAARVYFADVYLSSHDEQAFFEYIYHRVSGLRYLAMLQTALDSCPSGSEAINRRLQMIELHLTKSHGTDVPKFERSRVRMLKTATDNARGVCDAIATEYPRFATLLHDLGAFSFVRRDQALRNELANQQTHDRVRQSLSAAVYHSRRHAIKTLDNAFFREHRRISATTTPDTWLGWIDQLLVFDIPELAGRWSELRDTKRLPDDFNLPDLTDEYAQGDQRRESITQSCESLSRELTQLKLHLLRGKLEYISSTKAAAAEIARLLVGAHKTSCAALATELVEWCETNKSTLPSTTAWVRTTNLIKLNESWTKDKIYLLRCWCELARGAGGQGRTRATATILSSLRIRLTGPNKKHQAHHAVEMESLLWHLTQDVLRLEADLKLHEFPMWRYFDKSPDEDHDQLLDVERKTHELEDRVRVSAASTIEYAHGRAHSLTVRARALYLRGQFREAHRVLTLSTSDLGDSGGPDRFSRAVAHLFRAELLAISADTHLREYRDVAPSIRKIETAIENLQSAARWLEPAAHRSMWWLHIYAGRAQVRHEQLLLHVLRLAEGNLPPDWTYTHGSLWLEECVLDGLRSLRLALDTLPFIEQRPPTVSPLVDVEEKLLALWVRLFVAAFGYSHLLITRLQIPHLAPPQIAASGWFEYMSWTRSIIDDLKSKRVAPISALITPQGFWRKRWSAWCELRQFYHFATDPCKLVIKGDVISRKLEAYDIARSHQPLPAAATFREDLIAIERRLILDKQVDKALWDERRKPALS